MGLNINSKTVIKLKCVWCGAEILKYWDKLPECMRDFCNRDCMNAFRSAGLHSIDAEDEIVKQLGVATNYRDTPPDECMGIGRLSCLQCRRRKCVLDIKHQGRVLV